MAAYLIITRAGPVRDPEAMARYGAMNRAAADSFRERFGIRPLAVYGATETLEGDPAPDGVILLEFPDADAARGWYRSDEYQAALPHRQAAADYTITLVEGLPSPPRGTP